MRKDDGTYIIGIDLGTTNSLVATIDNGRPVIIPNRIGEALTASAVSLDAGTILVGAAARARAVRFPLQSATSFKRDMGTNRTFDLGGEVFSPVELSALVLSSLKADAEAVLGGPVSEAVVTVPAYFGEAQRRATRSAANIAGLTCERIINEPTAAALAYGFQNRSEETLLVAFDLGGGTCDTTVLRLTDGIIEILGSSGDTQLGGDDFVQAMVEHCAAEHAIESHDPVVREIAEQAMKTLSHSTEFVADIPCHDGLQTARWHLTRATAESLWSELLERIRTPILKAMRDAQCRPDAVFEVLLVGGASRIPCVRRAVKNLLGRDPLQSLSPDEAVAMGAAVQAALKIDDASVEDIVATDIAPFSLGITTAERIRGRFTSGLFTPIIERGTVLPVSRAKIFSTLGPAQTEIAIEVYQGEHSIVDRNTHLGSYSISGLPQGQINSVEVCFSYDLNGILEVDTLSFSTGEVASLLITPHDTALTQEEIERSRARLSALKVHPREYLPNRVALERGEAIYTTLLGEARERLGIGLAAFRSALDLRQHIDEEREHLISLMRELTAAWSDPR